MTATEVKRAMNKKSSEGAAFVAYNVYKTLDNAHSWDYSATVAKEALSVHRRSRE